MQMLMMNNANSLLSRDSFSLQLIIEEGIFSDDCWTNMNDFQIILRVSYSRHYLF